MTDMANRLYGTLSFASVLSIITRVPKEIPTGYGPSTLPLRQVKDHRRRGAQIRGRNRLSADATGSEAMQCNYVVGWRTTRVQTPRWHKLFRLEVRYENYLVDSGLWQCIMSSDVDEELYQRALAKINLSIKPCAWAEVRKAKTAKEAWESLRGAYEDKGIVRRIGLYSSLFNTRFDDCDSMTNYIDRITSIAEQLEAIR
ncbi:hypothetical protein M513_13310 [Trichuris suis]|uniref:Uncharacterized protein n=1 Tax=Trichuris suis TaxID=68888 RepID=A0A085LLH0_9BILA|nr:hypothetical protein M513_13310 [Trichuris suis]